MMHNRHYDDSQELVDAASLEEFGYLAALRTGTGVHEPDFLVGLGTARGHEIHLPEDDCTTEIVQ